MSRPPARAQGTELRVQTGEPPAEARSVRERVFVVEQGVEREEEWDEHDATATHFVALRDGAAVGCARLREVDDVGKVERVAVLAELRREGWGRVLMDAVEAEARRRGLRRLLLHAQHGALAFYTALGWRAFGPDFDEAGIPHRKMDKALDPHP